MVICAWCDDVIRSAPAALGPARPAERSVHAASHGLCPSCRAHMLAQAPRPPAHPAVPLAAR